MKQKNANVTIVISSVLSGNDLVRIGTVIDPNLSGEERDKEILKVILRSLEWREE